MQSHHQQPPQPPKQAAYNQASNPVTHTPSEQRIPQNQSSSQSQYDRLPRHRGDALPAITRNAASQPSNSQDQSTKHQASQQTMRNAGETLDTEYGVEQQPAEGDIAHAVQSKSADARARAQAGAHAGAVGSAEGPGAPGYEKGEMADLDQKREMHDRMLGDRVGQSPAEPEGETEAVRRRKLRQDEEVDVVGAASRGSAGKVV
ncbi:hypothetical protein CBS115989_4050 [Aspergillus niger]|uniref:Uncharacterized protein n=1 Tax=Aspergillus niger ATCC 13496 TaxID=1353008 RepID=A0A370C704_ASPNG|nr:hypothetical protein CBS115989_4050 [Aspergillus niger]KAI2845377.1 hypothetical protein CBS11232_7705 [Aspergillus niger]KAI2872060.1 hypothetical protein CBS115988_8088 [Aspergillus niger]RDH22386.1 hypothetical protein M747DRAFT_368570 [Aspergillus niger ATCC 13496]|eukprot:XP_001396876.2 hypothetical protein ANI_1_1362134 [Aspergillus niger CBS 513.88]